MIHVTCRLTVKNRDQLGNPTIGNRVWTTFTFWVSKRVRVRAGVSEFERDALSPGRLDQQHHVRAVHSQSRPVGRLSDPDLCAQRRRRGTAILFTHHRSVELSGAARGEGGKLPRYGWTSRNYVICVCFHCHGTSSYHTPNTLQGRQAKSHVDTQTIQPGLGDFVL